MNHPRLLYEELFTIHECSQWRFKDSHKGKRLGEILGARVVHVSVKMIPVPPPKSLILGLQEIPGTTPMEAPAEMAESRGNVTASETHRLQKDFEIHRFGFQVRLGMLN